MQRCRSRYSADAVDLPEMSFTKDFVRGCLIDFLMAVAAMILLGYYWDFRGTLFLIVAVWLALAGLIFIPWEDEKKQDSRNCRRC